MQPCKYFVVCTLYVLGVTLASSVFRYLTIKQGTAELRNNAVEERILVSQDVRYNADSKSQCFLPSAKMKFMRDSVSDTLSHVVLFHGQIREQRYVIGD